MKIGVVAALRIAAVTAMMGALAACAGDIAKPDAVVMQLPADHLDNPHVAGITAEASSGAAMTQTQIDHLRELVIAQIKAGSSQIMDDAAASAPNSMTVKIMFTRYDAGSAFERAMLIGLGQIHIDADVTFIDKATGNVVGNYKISKDFSLGGLGGAFTTMDEVEVGFAKSVAAVVLKKSS